MTHCIPKNTPTNRTEASAPATQASGPCTPAHHARTSKAKPVRLLALGDGPPGKTALLEFPEGWQRTIYLPAQADAWHPMFDELPADERRRLRTHTDHPVIRHPDGTRTKQGALSFMTKEINRSGGCAEQRFFDVPAETYGTGYVTGYRCAAELLEALQRGYGPYISVREITEGAIQAADEETGKASRRGAGYGFLSVVDDAMQFMARHAQHGEYMARKIAEVERSNAWVAEQDAREKAAFVERMKAARLSKAQRRVSTTAQH